MGKGTRRSVENSNGGIAKLLFLLIVLVVVKMRPRNLERMSISFWGESVYVPIHIGDTNLLKWIEYFDYKTKTRYKSRHKYIIFDLSDFIPKDVFELGKTSNPIKQWEAQVEANKLVNKLCKKLIDDIILFLVENYPDKKLYSDFYYGTGFWIE